MQDYEYERESVIKVLEQYHINTDGLMDDLISTNGSDADSSSAGGSKVGHRELSDAVNQLGENLNESLVIIEQMNKKIKNLSKSVASTEDFIKTLNDAQLEIDNLKQQRSAYEEKIETMKISLKKLQNDYDNILKEKQICQNLVDSLTNEVRQEKEKVQYHLKEIESLTKKDDSILISPEIQALEEENIELMQENKVLRQESALRQQQAQKALQELHQLKLKYDNISNESNVGKIDTVTTSERSKRSLTEMHPDDIEKIVKSTRFNEENKLSAKETKEATMTKIDSKAVEITVTTEKLSNSENENPNLSKIKSRKILTKVPSVSSEPVKDEDVPAECVQS
jgi:DNA repair exonuclease SbcCD ATPase subunit